MHHPSLNQALAFLKPHVAANPNVLAYIESALAEVGIAVVAHRDWSAKDLRAAGVVDRHYAAHARAGTCLDPTQLEVGEDARRAFVTAFATRWEDALAAGRVASGQVAQQRLGLTAEALSARWLRSGARKLAGGLYAAHFVEENLYVLNGFYPSVREDFAADGAHVLVLLLDFSPERLPWQRFRESVVGVTNPAAAEQASIRGFLHARQADFGIQVTYRQNVIHASASAFEALCEKAIWLPERPFDCDPLWQAFEGRGPAFARLCAWREENPAVTLDGRTGTLLDLLENLDTDPTAERLRQLAARATAV